jgi:SLOG cluster3 family
MMRSVFLSASLPSSCDTSDSQSNYAIATRESICAFVREFVPSGSIIFGGHPAIAPIIKLVCHEIQPNLGQYAILYESRVFRRALPSEVKAFIDVRFVDAVGGDEAPQPEGDAEDDDF